jgi:hypothetical protein
MTAVNSFLNKSHIVMVCVMCMYMYVQILSRFVSLYLRLCCAVTCVGEPRHSFSVVLLALTATPCCDMFRKLCDIQREGGCTLQETVAAV